MRSRPARLTLSALAWTALGTAAFFTFTVQQQIDQRRAALRGFETVAREAADALHDVQAGQQSYVAHGQQPREWMPKVSTYLQTAATSIDTLRATAKSQTAGPALLDASTAITLIGNVDRRVRERLASADAESAADAIFSEAADAVSSAVSNVDAALDAEQQAADAFDAGQQRVQVYSLGSVAGLVAMLLAMLGFAAPVGRAQTLRDAAAADEPRESATPLPSADPMRAAMGDAPAPAPASVSDTAASVDALKSAATLCTEFGRVRDAAQLKVLLEQAAGAMNARGLIVWLGSTTGADLRPVLAYGYTDSTLARIATVPRTADNAAAAAYRMGEVQIVKSRPGASQGAVVAPILGVDGCIGALTAEIRDRSEDSDTTRSIALIVASQLASVLAGAANEAAAHHGAAALPSSQAAAG